MPYGKRKYTKRTMRRRRPAYRKRTSVSRATKKYVKRIVHSNIENKIIVVNQVNNSVTTALVGASIPFIINCIPNIPSGSDQGERQGVVVTPRAITVRGFINMKPHNSTTNPFAPIKVKMWLVSYKLQNRNTATLALGDFDRYFEAGNSSVGFQGNMLDMLLPINKSDWIVYATKTINLGTSSTSTAYTGSGFTYDASRFSVPFSFNVGKHLKQKIMYDDANASQPTNRNMSIIIQAVSAEGSSGGGAYTTCEVHYSHKFEFEDA